MDEALLQERLLARATFGARPGDAGQLRERGAEAWLDAELQVAGSPSDAALAPRLARFPALAWAASDFLEGEAIVDPESMEGRRRADALLRIHARSLRTAAQMSAARVVRAVHGPGGVHEVMVDFWSNHFSVDARKSIVGGLLPPFQRDVLDRHALGRFEDLLLAVARSPAMLVSLDNWTSTAASARPGLRGRRRARGINENYARELLELHTLGVRAGYTQDDVISTARALTGWSVESRERPEFRFHAPLHDDAPKVVLGERVPGAGADEGEALLRRLARHPATARHVSWKLARRFVADAPPEPLVARAAARWLETGGDVASVLRTILLSPDMHAPGNRKLRTPLRLYAAALRAGGGETAGDDDTLFALARLGELPYFARTPKGFPEEAERWIDPGAVLERMRLGVALARGDSALALRVAGPEFQWC